jgi:transposase InsO family protein
MMDGRCRFGPRAKREMVSRLLAGEKARAIARSMGCSPTTVTTARERWLEAGDVERASGAWCAPRRPVPKSCPWALSDEDEQAILSAREKTNWGPMRLTWLTGRHRSTCWKVLKRHGVSRQRRSEPRQTTRRYEWAEAGALLHIDAFELAKFDRPGHWAHGDRSERNRSRRAGKVKVIGVIDDHTRLAYCELHGAENAIAVSATLRRAAAWMREQGCGPVQAVMSDNAKCYATSHDFRDTLNQLGARHILTPPRTPRWNGKIERFFGTLDTEWAHARVWPDSTTRDRALSSFLRFYNRRRPHSAAGGRPPITRVQQVRGHDS